ncbi:flavin monoamine oxidase family protein [Amycolatopsis sp. NPDC058986]|uniref:flavin monoamine oxidase family protein n=1 Tax=unclassified Amycolatopsis TaxID=2618356 RepID=UPI00366CA1E3
MTDGAGRDGISRRRFLSAVGAAGGAGTMFATMGALGLAPTARADSYQEPRKADFTLSGRAAAKVAILGGGITGLACAYELGKAGYDCTVLEAQNRIGGRNFTVRNGTEHTELGSVTQVAEFAGDGYLNAGPARIAQWMVTLDYCRELGVPVEVFTNTNANAYSYNESAGMKAPQRHRTAQADVYGYVSELLAKATDRGALDAELTAADKERLLDFLHEWGVIGDKGTGRQYTGSSRRGYSVNPGAGANEGTVLGPVPSLSEVFASGVGRYFFEELDYDQAMLMFQPIGGMDRIPCALAAAIGRERIRTGSRVRRISGGDRGVAVAYRTADGRDRELTADYCIAALPPHLLARIPHNLGPEVQAALATYHDSRVAAGKIGLEYTGRWWETDHRIYGGITWTDLDISEIWYPSHGHHGRTGVLVGYQSDEGPAQRYEKLSPKERELLALEQGAKIHGAKFRTELASSFSIAWRRVPHIEAAWTMPPFRTPAYQLLNQPAGRVYFSGDWLSYLFSWQAGAFESARQVVTVLHKRVLSAP